MGGDGQSTSTSTRSSTLLLLLLAKACGNGAAKQVVLAMTVSQASHAVAPKPARMCSLGSFRFTPTLAFWPSRTLGHLKPGEVRHPQLDGKLSEDPNVTLSLSRSGSRQVIATVNVLTDTRQRSHRNRDQETPHHGRAYLCVLARIIASYPGRALE